MTTDPTPAENPTPSKRSAHTPSGCHRHKNRPSRSQRFQRALTRAGIGVLAVIIVSLLTACGGSDTPAGSPSGTNASAVIGLTYIPNIQFAPFYVADHDELYGDAPVGLRHHGSSEGLFTALASGEEQFVVAGGDEILQARSEGVDVVAVASYYVRYPVRFIVPADSPITSVADMKGHTIGTPTFGENWFALLVALDQAGLTKEDVTVTDIGYTQQAALTTGKVDVVVGFANSDVLGFDAIDFPVSVIDPEVPLVSICLATTSTFAKENPAMVHTVIAGMRQGMSVAANDETVTLDTAAEYIPSFRDETLTTATRVLPATTALFSDQSGTISPALDPEQWIAMGTALTSVGLIPAEMDINAAYTNEYQES